MIEGKPPGRPILRGATTRQSGKAGRAEPPRVLLAEDTPISAEMMCAMADRLDIAMDVAANGLEALEMVRAAKAEGRPYSLLLADVNMPVLDGIELTRRLRRNGLAAADLPIIAVTAAISNEEIRTYRQAGMQAFLAKPVGLAELRGAIDAWSSSEQNVEPVKAGGHQTGAKSADPRALWAALAAKFAERKLGTAAAIDTALALDTIDEDTVLHLRTLLHQLAGTAGSFGEEQLSDEARAHETDLMATWLTGGDLNAVLAEAKASLESD